MMETPEIAISVRNVVKRYGGSKKKPVLDSLNMNVVRGHIYGLLGASGCGKTTLLGAIVGAKPIDSGQILVLGSEPGKSVVKKIGYMPQDIALVGEFSVKEAIQHYGWIFGMSDEEIEERFNFLDQLLELPPSNKLIKNCSGGQQRRVSMAVVMVHNPDVLIMDEPTVGLDPVLRQAIWDHLVDLAEKEGKTIIITTHYIEEAAQAHALGLMRNGKLLAEGAPIELLSRFNCSSVEEVFLLLSRKQEECPDSADTTEEDITMDCISDPPCNPKEILMKQEEVETGFVTVKRSARRQFGHARALMSKNIAKVVRNFGTMAFCYGFPLVQCFLFFWTIGSDPENLPVGIVNYELGSFNDCHEYALNQTELLGGKHDNDTFIDECQYTGLSCKFIFSLPEQLKNIKYFKTLDEAKKWIRAGKLVTVLEFSENFTPELGRYLEGKSQSNESLDEMQVNVYEDNSQMPIALFVKKYVLESYLNFTKDVMRDCDYNPKARDVPINFHYPVYGNKDPQYREFMAPGFLLTCSLFLAVSVSGLSIVTERTEGVWERTLVSGVSKTEILVYHFIVMAIVNFFQNMLMFIVTFFCFNMVCVGSKFDFLIILTAQGFAGTALGTTLSVISKTVTDCILMTLGSCYPFLVLCGVAWPIQGMSAPMQFISKYFIPSTLATESAHFIIHRGWDFSNPLVQLGLFSAIGWTIFFILLNIVILKYEKR